MSTLYSKQTFRFPLMEALIRDVSRVVLTAPLLWFHIPFDSICRTKKTLNSHCTTDRTHSQSLSLPLLWSCFFPLYVNVCVCVCVFVCVFPLLQVFQCHYETSSTVTSCQFSRNQKQARQQVFTHFCGSQVQQKENKLK